VYKHGKPLRDFDLVQHITGPTHNKRHTLDLFITHRTTSVSVHVDPPVMSDHSLIIGQISINTVNTTGSEPVIKRRWNTFDVDAFKQDLSSTDLVINPPTTCSDFLACYDRTLRQLLDRHAPQRPTKRRLRTVSPWYNKDCHHIKNETRRLEKIYRSTHTAEAHRQWREQFDKQRRAFNLRFTEYWSTTIKDSEDSKTLWSRMNCLLRPDGGVCNPHSAAAFAEFFDGKVSDIRSRTADIAPPIIVPRDVPMLANFESCTSEEVASMIHKAPNKHCELDPAPTWLVKQCSDVLAPVIALLTNRSFQEASFPDGGKTAIVKPILKKPNLDRST